MFTAHFPYNSKRVCIFFALSSVRMRALLFALCLMTVQAQAKVLVLVTEADPVVTSFGVNGHELSTLINLSSPNGKIQADFATPHGGFIGISGKTLEYLQPKSLVEIIEGMKLTEYNGLIVIGGPEALYTFPNNLYVQTVMEYFNDNELPMALSGYGQAALVSEVGVSRFAGQPVAAYEPSQTNSKRLDRMLIKNGLVVVSKLNGNSVISVRDGKLITGQDWRSFDKLLEEFLQQIPQENKVPVQN